MGPPGPVMAIRRLVMAASAGAPSISPRSFCFSALSSAASVRHCSQAARCAWARSRSAPPSSPSTRADSRSPRWLMAPPQDQATTAEGLAMERGGGPAVLKRGAQLGPAAVDPAAHRTQLHAQRGRDLLVGEALDVAQDHGGPVLRRERLERGLDVVVQVAVVERLRRGGLRARSEEHTSELQSHVNLVCRLLLEKKK